MTCACREVRGRGGRARQRGSRSSQLPLPCAECFDEAGSEGDLACVGDDKADAAAELDAHLALRRMTDLDLDEGHVGDAPRNGDG
jgi:hypothetical protein